MKKIIFLIMACAALVSCESKMVKPSHWNISDYKNKTIDADKYFREGQYKKAAKSYKSTMTDNISPEDLFKYAESLRLSHQPSEAIKVYDKVLNLEKDSLYAMEGKSLCYVQNGKFKEAAKLLSIVLSQDATKWRAINALGVIYATTGHMEEALKYYNMALDLNPNSPIVLNNIGLSIAFSGNEEKGREIIEKALSHIQANNNESRRKVEYNLALIYGISGNINAAEKLLSKHLTDAQVMNNLGFYAKLSGDTELAKTYLSKALSVSPVHYEKAWDNLQSIGG